MTPHPPPPNLLVYFPQWSQGPHKGLCVLCTKLSLKYMLKMNATAWNLKMPCNQSPETNKANLWHTFLVGNLVCTVWRIYMYFLLITKMPYVYMLLWHYNLTVSSESQPQWINLNQTICFKWRIKYLATVHSLAPVKNTLSYPVIFYLIICWKPIFDQLTVTG